MGRVTSRARCSPSSCPSAARARARAKRHRALPRRDPAISQIPGLTAAPSVNGAVPQPRSRLSPGRRTARGCARSCSAPRGSWPEHPVVALPVVTPDLDALRRNRSAATVTWIGHSTVLVQLDGVNFLTDPTLGRAHRSLRRARSAWRGTPPPAMRMEDLPPIDFVADLPRPLRPPRRADGAAAWRACSIPASSCRSASSPWLADRGITNAVELDWGESVTFEGPAHRLHARPARLRPHARRPGAAALVLVGGARIEAVLLRRRYRATTATSRRSATRWGRSTWPRCPSGRTRRARSRAPSTSRPRRPCRR